ncbi:hypothetical protein [Yinghuangia soli]|uniref:Uncharacterized protein n=1 Tax=Yinghuangia soli TaxID=2908204 RepID=A0AA41Q5W7_9ACTN|nr:hypothetical protein [Yinghuangia soli]MCF2531545.1 hypothetical protein [Yinghuangia soli]
MTETAARGAAPTGNRSLSAALCEDVVAKLVAASDLIETSATVLATTAGHPAGRLRVFEGEAVAHAVYIALTVPAIGLDSHMVFAFGPAQSCLPHFTLDSVATGDAYAFHLDLVQRADLAVHLDYMDAVYGPLTETYLGARALPGLTEAAIGPRQRALMSPWMLVHRASEEAFRAIDGPVHAYLDHWLALAADGVPKAVAGTLAGTDLPERDRALRRLLFSRDVDPVWAQVSRLLGDEETDRLRALLVHGPSTDAHEKGDRSDVL